MIRDAEKFADEDKKLKEKVDSRTELESYAYSLKNQISDKEKLGAKLNDDEKTKIESAIDETIKWMEQNVDVDAEENKKQKKDLEGIVQPIIAKLYQGAGGVPPSEDSDNLKDEL
ncbi:endoplasmic reticulum chaperone BiP-like [Teleopsis dalmanni]|nr:endoplasmic reticulum chaperone BiP-like [Teleopsis dalmanni]